MTLILLLILVSSQVGKHKTVSGSRNHLLQAKLAPQLRKKKAFVIPRQACQLKGGSAKEESLLGKDEVKWAGMECKHEPARRGDSWGGPTTTTPYTLNKTGANTSLERHITNILEKDDHCGVKAKPGLTSCQMERKTSKYFLPYFIYRPESEEHDISQYTLSLGCIIRKEKFTKIDRHPDMIAY